MSNKRYPSDMTDRQWNNIRDLIPPAKPGGRPRVVSMRRVLDGLGYLIVNGCHWRALPSEYPRWQTVYSYFRQWSRDGTWRAVHHRLAQRLRWPSVCVNALDATAGRLLEHSTASRSKQPTFLGFVVMTLARTSPVASVTQPLIRSGCCWAWLLQPHRYPIPPVVSHC